MPVVARRRRRRVAGKAMRAMVVAGSGEATQREPRDHAEGERQRDEVEQGREEEPPLMAASSASRQGRNGKTAETTLITS